MKFIVVMMPSIPPDMGSWDGSLPSVKPMASVISFSNKNSVYLMLFEWSYKYFCISELLSCVRMVGGM